MDGGGSVLALVGALRAGVGVSVFLGPGAGVATMIAAMAMAPVTFGIVAARRLMNHGFAQADLDPAFASELDTVREEQQRAAAARARDARAGVATRSRASALTTSVTLTPLAIAGAFRPAFASVPLLLQLVLAGTAAVTIAWLGVRQLHRDVDVSFWRAAWTGRFGRFAFAAATTVWRYACRRAGAHPSRHRTVTQPRR